MSGRDGFVTVSPASPRSGSLKHWGINNPFKEDDIKRDGKGQFSVKASGPSNPEILSGGALVDGINYHLIDGHLYPEIPLAGSKNYGNDLEMAPDTYYRVHTKGRDAFMVPEGRTERSTKQGGSGPVGTSTNREATWAKAGVRKDEWKGKVKNRLDQEAVEIEQRHKNKKDFNKRNKEVGTYSKGEDTGADIQYKVDKTKNRIKRFLRQDDLGSPDSLDDVLMHHGLRRRDKDEMEHAEKKFSETQVKRDGKGQFSTKSGTKSNEAVDQGFLDLANSRIKDPSLLTSIRDSFQRIMDQNMRMKHIENSRSVNGKTGYYDRDEMDYVKDGTWSPSLG